jgi:hypothetical protein
VQGGRESPLHFVRAEQREAGESLEQLAADLLLISPGGRKKVCAPPHRLHDEDCQNQARLHDPALDRFRLPACALYNGPHYWLVMEGVQALRCAEAAAWLERLGLGRAIQEA